MSPPSQVAHRYVIESRLGAGGMSTVFKANDTVLERPVAVKLLAEHLADDEAFVARFRREALSAARLQHPNIVQVFDSGQDPESQRHYIVMEYVDGPVLREPPARAEGAGHRRHRAGGARRLPRPRLRPPRRRHPPRRQAREPAGGPGELPHQAGRLRHRQGGRADADHPGGLDPGDRRLSLARAGPRRRGGTRVGHLLPRGVRLPVPRRPAAARVRLPHRARPQAAAGSRCGRSPTIAPRCRTRSTSPCACPSIPTRVRATRRRSTWPRRSRPGVQGETTEITRRLAIGDQDLDADPCAGRHGSHARVCRAPAWLAARAPGAANPAGARPRASSRRARSREARRAAARRRWGVFLALLAVLVAVAVVVIALSSTGAAAASRRPTPTTSTSSCRSCGS